MSAHKMSAFRETVMSAYLEEFIENRECYNCDCSDAIHEYCDGTAAGMQYRDMMNIIDSMVGFLSVLKIILTNMVSLILTDQNTIAMLH